MSYSFTYPSVLRKYNPINKSSMKEAILYALYKYYIEDKQLSIKEYNIHINKLFKIVEKDLLNNKYSLIYSPGTGNRDFKAPEEKSQEQNIFKSKFSKEDKIKNIVKVKKHGEDSFKNFIGGKYQKLTFKEYFLNCKKPNDNNVNN